MYESFFNLSDQPFKLNPDPRFFFGSRSHNKAMAYLHYGLRQAEGFIVITGEIGAGKSIMISHLIDQLDRSNVVAAHLLTPNLKAEDLLPHILSSFNIEPSGAGKTAEIEAFEDFLFDQMNRGRRVLLIIDEAQNLPADTLEELRILSNLDYDGTPLFQVFLVGQPEFKPVIAADNMEQLRQRIIASYHLDPLNAEETTAYIKHRLRVAGWKNDPTFTDRAFALINEASGGVPRKINKLCNRLLLYCAIEKRRDISAKVVRAVVDDLANEDVSGSPMRLAPATADEDHDGMFRPVSNGIDHAYEPNPDQSGGAADDPADDRSDDARDGMHGDLSMDAADDSDAPQSVEMDAVPAPHAAVASPPMSRDLPDVSAGKDTIDDTATGEPATRGGLEAEPEDNSEDDTRRATSEKPSGHASSPAVADTADRDDAGPDTATATSTPSDKPSIVTAAVASLAGESAFDRLRRQRSAARDQSAASRPVLRIDDVAANASAAAPVAGVTASDEATMDDVAEAIARVDTPAVGLATVPALSVATDVAAPEAAHSDEKPIGQPSAPSPRITPDATPVDASDATASAPNAPTISAAWRDNVAKSIDDTRTDLRAAHANVSKLRRKLDDIERRRHESQDRLVARLDRAESLLAELRDVQDLVPPPRI